MLKNLLLFFVCITSALIIQAQDFEFLPPIINPKPYSDKETTTLIAGTINYAKSSHIQQKVPYLNSIQIIDAHEPYPPVWYAATPLYTDEMFREDSVAKKLRFYHIGYVFFRGEYLAYLFLEPISYIKDGEHRVRFDSHWVVLDKMLNVKDTTNTPFYYGGKIGEDVQSNSSLEKLLTEEVFGKLNLSGITGNSKDTAVLSSYWVVNVLDKNDNVKFTWNPLLNTPELFHVKEEIEIQERENNEEPIKWGKINSAIWDYDGNILYASQFGVGKVSKKDGRLIWKVPNSSEKFLHDTQSLMCYEPTYLSLCKEESTSCTYAFFEKGIENLCSGQGVVFEQDKKTFEIKNVKYFTPQKQYSVGIHGGFEYNPENGSYAMDYGVFEDNTTASFWETMEHYANGYHSVFLLPRFSYAFGFNFFQWKQPPRPVIKKEGAGLKATGNYNQYTWYKFECEDDTIITKAGTGNKIKFDKNSVYCVVSPYGIGYSVSALYCAQ